MAKTEKKSAPKKKTAPESIRNTPPKTTPAEDVAKALSDAPRSKDGNCTVKISAAMADLLCDLLGDDCPCEPGCDTCITDECACKICETLSKKK